jgi:hypothetical protein
MGVVTAALGRTRLFTRYEAVQVETDLQRFGTHDTGKLKIAAHVIDDLNRRDVVQTLTLGGVRIVSERAGWDVGVGGDATFYGVPSVLQPTHGRRPVSFHLFVRVRPPSAGRMHDMTMTSPHAAAGSAHDHRLP